MAITTGSAANLLWPGLNKIFGGTYDEYPLQCMDIFESESSDKHFLRDLNLNGFGLAVHKAEGTGITYDELSQGWRVDYTPKVFGLAYSVSREAVEDDLYRELSAKGAKRLAFSLRQTKEVHCANVLNRAFDSNYLMDGSDGVELGSSAHLLSKGGTFANELATTADLSELSLEQAIIDIGNMKNDAGLRIRIVPQKLIIPIELQFEAERILKSTLQNDTANNATNALRSRGMLPGGVSLNNYLTDPDAWFIKTNCPDGMKLVQRRGADFTNDTDFDTENMKFKATERYIAGWTDPRGLFCVAGA